MLFKLYHPPRKHYSRIFEFFATKKLFFEICKTLLKGCPIRICSAKNPVLIDIFQQPGLLFLKELTCVKNFYF
ncbi:hypothetical protein BEL04_06600 [Mucilaginibacter sp. PPCGB 2223]|nr:hypothetical protein BEL04_06600 [Mucilaginibacter sp. PPCGB 2223]